MNSADIIDYFLTALKEAGCSISIDDFGTGYSTLSYIKRFDIDVIKIAKELIDNIESKEHDYVIVKAIMAMVNEIGLATIAEGVEDKQHLSILSSLGRDMVQGYYTGRTMPKEKFEELLNGKSSSNG
jgi:EAL domain-containing protein (putative c-di-GMP-specific phosphodiesterase class I)